MAMELGPCRVLWGRNVRGTAWAPLTIYGVGVQRILDDGVTRRLYIVTTSGTSGATLPTIPTSTGDSITDGSVVWGFVSTGPLNLGGTLGGVTVKIETSSVDLKTDQFGTSAVDTILTGEVVEVEMTLTEIGLGSNLTRLFHGTMISADTSDSVLPGDSKVGMSLVRLYPFGTELQLIKYVNGAPSTNRADRIIFPEADPIDMVELTFDSETQRGYRFKFKCYPVAVEANWGENTGLSTKTVTYFFGDEFATA